MYDVVIIGAGVTGCAIAREVSRLNLKTCVLEKADDVCEGTSKANSAIIHAGYDPVPGSLMARLNVRGNEMIEGLSEELDFPFKRNGSLVVCLHEEDKEKLTALYNKGKANGVRELRLLGREELKQMEPNISDQAIGALYAPTGGIVCPFQMTIAFAENAAENGVTFKLHSMVEGIEKVDGIYRIKTENEIVEARYVINAAGVYADKIHNMVSEKKMTIIPRRGEYCLLDKAAGNHVTRTIFQLPGKLGKGVLVTPTVHGNLLVGPTALDIEDKDGINTTREGLDYVMKASAATVADIPFRQVITSFAGLRAHEAGHEFIIEEVEDAKGFIDAAGIESPGLSSAPAIGEMVREILETISGAALKEHFKRNRKGILRPADLSAEEYGKLLKEKPEYGNIICRCEVVTEGEILDAIHRPLGAKSLDGIKRRTRAGMGRCQAGFCSPKVMEILERELSMKMTEICKADKGSELVVGNIKEEIC